MRFRLVYRVQKVTGVRFVSAPSMAEAIARLMLEVDGAELVSAMVDDVASVVYEMPRPEGVQ